MTTQNFQNLTDEQLVVRFQTTQDNLVFGEIYNRHFKKVYHTCLGVVKDWNTASDLVQDVMLKVLEALPNLEHPQLLGYWMYRIAQNHAIQFCKDRKKQLSVSVDERFDLADDLADKEILENREQLFDGMDKVLSLLSIEDRTFISLKYFDNHSVEDLQIRFSLSKSAVKMRLARARKRMAKLYKREMPLALCA